MIKPVIAIVSCLLATSAMAASSKSIQVQVLPGSQPLIFNFENGTVITPAVSPTGSPVFALSAAQNQSLAGKPVTSIFVSIANGSDGTVHGHPCPILTPAPPMRYNYVMMVIASDTYTATSTPFKFSGNDNYTCSVSSHS
jgi:hypothetical protein